jgi:hypothetical protein
LKNRYCESCHRWWCEDCYELPGLRSDTSHKSQPWGDYIAGPTEKTEKNVKVHMGLCAENCLVGEMMSGAGSNGMWG